MLDTELITDEEALWGRFRQYCLDPYKSAPDCLTAISSWFDDLYGRRTANGLSLSHHRIEDISTGQHFDSFGLNGMYFSQNPAVLTLPHLPDLKNPSDASDKFVGVLLADIGTQEEKEREFYQKWLQKIKGRNSFSGPYRGQVFNKLKTMLIDYGLPTVDVATLIPSVITLRIAKDSPIANQPHRDNSRRLFGGALWKRVTINVLEGMGTTYYLGPKEDIAIAVPKGTTSSHLQVESTKKEHRSLGVLHKATKCPEGRAVLVPTILRPIKFKRTPASRWRILTP